MNIACGGKELLALPTLNPCLVISLVNANIFMNANCSDVSVFVWQDKHAEEVRKNKEMKEEACR